MKSLIKYTLSAVALATLAACATDDKVTAPSEFNVKAEAQAKSLAESPRVTPQMDRTTESEDVHIPVSARKVSEHKWLTSKKVTLKAGKDAIPMSEVLRSLANQGLSITSELPLDRFYYSGYTVTDVDAETALRAVVGSVGLDYVVNDESRLIQIKPMSSKTWYLNLGKRNSKFSSGATANPTISQGGLTAGSNLTGGGSNVTAIQTTEDFWDSLKVELDARLKVMLPEPPKSEEKTASAVPAAASAGLPALALPPGATGVAAGLPPLSTAGAVSPQGRSDGLLNLVSKQIGTFSLNPETGAITVQAPHWIHDELDVYIKRVQDMYNTDLLFEGQLLVLTADDAKSEGLDITAFAQFAQDNYGLAYTNNGLGGLTIGNTVVNGLKTITAASPSVAGPTLGIVSAVDGLAIFNAYLSTKGVVNTLQKPTLTTTSGVPADFRRVVTKYFNNVSQEVTPGTATTPAIITTKNQLIPQDIGTILRVNPRIDISTGLIRAQIELIQTTQTGEQSIPQAISGGASADLLTLKIPVLSKVLYSGEALMKDGNMIVMGGQVEEGETTSRNGVTGLMDAAGVGPLFGKNVKQKTNSVFYFAMKVRAKKR